MIQTLVRLRPHAAGVVRRLVDRRATPLAAGLAASLVLGACSGESATEPASSLQPTSIAAVAAPLSALIEEPFQLVTPTYDGSGQAVHPDIVDLPGGWRGQRYWMAMTPYPKSDYHLENPSILVSDDGVSLRVPDGLTNPVVGKSGHNGDYNSDPELVYEAATDRLLLYYRFVERRTNTIRVSSTVDGRTWKRERNAFWARSHAAVSPTVTPRAGSVPAKMWYVDAGKAGCHTGGSRVVMRTANDSMNRSLASGAAPIALRPLTAARWSEPEATDLAQPGYVVWHLKVRWIPSKSQYWALYSAFPKGQLGCDIDDLFFARSADGIHWETFPQPVLRHEDRAWTGAAVYRSTFVYLPETDELRIWLSARSVEGAWSLGLARFRYSRELEELSSTGHAGPRTTPSLQLRALTPLGEAP
jgi:hypothetical protein